MFRGYALIFLWALLAAVQASIVRSHSVAYFPTKFGIEKNPSIGQISVNEHAVLEIEVSIDVKLEAPNAVLADGTNSEVDIVKEATAFFVTVEELSNERMDSGESSTEDYPISWNWLDRNGEEFLHSSSKLTLLVPLQAAPTSHALERTLIVALVEEQSNRRRSISARRFANVPTLQRHSTKDQQGSLVLSVHLHGHTTVVLDDGKCHSDKIQRQPAERGVSLGLLHVAFVTLFLSLTYLSIRHSSSNISSTQEDSPIRPGESFGSQEHLRRAADHGDNPAQPQEEFEDELQLPPKLERRKFDPSDLHGLDMESLPSDTAPSHSPGDVEVAPKYDHLSDDDSLSEIVIPLSNDRSRSRFEASCTHHEIPRTIETGDGKILANDCDPINILDECRQLPKQTENGLSVRQNQDLAVSQVLQAPNEGTDFNFSGSSSFDLNKNQGSGAESREAIKESIPFWSVAGLPSVSLNEAGVGCENLSSTKEEEKGGTSSASIKQVEIQEGTNKSHQSQPLMNAKPASRSEGQELDEDEFGQEESPSQGAQQPDVIGKETASRACLGDGKASPDMIAPHTVVEAQAVHEICSRGGTALKSHPENLSNDSKSGESRGADPTGVAVRIDDVSSSKVNATLVNKEYVPEGVPIERLEERNDLVRSNRHEAVKVVGMEEIRGRRPDVEGNDNCISAPGSSYVSTLPSDSECTSLDQSPSKKKKLGKMLAISNGKSAIAESRRGEASRSRKRSRPQSDGPSYLGKRARRRTEESMANAMHHTVKEEDDFYIWTNLWDHLSDAGWKYVRARNPLHDWYYIQSGCDVKGGTLGVDYFTSPDDVIKYAKKNDFKQLYGPGKGESEVGSSKSKEPQVEFVEKVKVERMDHQSDVVLTTRDPTAMRHLGGGIKTSQEKEHATEAALDPSSSSSGTRSPQSCPFAFREVSPSPMADDVQRSPEDVTPSVVDAKSKSQASSRQRKLPKSMKKSFMPDHVMSFSLISSSKEIEAPVWKVDLT